MPDPQSALPNCSVAQRKSRSERQTLALALVLVFPWGGQISTQQRPAYDPSLQNPRNTLGRSETDSDEIELMREEKRLRLLNAERQKSMVADTDKLLKLVRDFNAEVAKEDSSTLTPNELRQLGEIERLAHNVKDKMSTSVRGVPVYLQPSPVFR